MDSNRRAPTQLELCFEKQIREIHRLRDVSRVDDHILERLLPKCTAQQLAVVENCTKDRDISPITSNLWRKFYEFDFGVENAKSIIQRMGGEGFKWKEIYEAKTKKREEATRERLQRGYAEAQTLNRQIKRTSYIPPTGSRKKIWWRNFLILVLIAYPVARRMLCERK